MVVVVVVAAEAVEAGAIRNCVIGELGYRAAELAYLRTRKII